MLGDEFFKTFNGLKKFCPLIHIYRMQLRLRKFKKKKYRNKNRRRMIIDMSEF